MILFFKIPKLLRFNHSLGSIKSHQSWIKGKFSYTLQNQTWNLKIIENRKKTFQWVHFQVLCFQEISNRTHWTDRQHLQANPYSIHGRIGGFLYLFTYGSVGKVLFKLSWNIIFRGSTVLESSWQWLLLLNQLQTWRVWRGKCWSEIPEKALWIM